MARGRVVAMPRGRGRMSAPPAPRGRGRGRSGSFLAPMGGRKAGRVANAEAGAEHNPEIRSLRQQAKGSRKRQQDIGSWYQQLAADYKGAQDAGSAALQSVQDTTSRQLAEASDRSSADQAKLAADNAAFAKLVGGPTDTSGLAKIAQAGSAAARSRVALNLPVAEEQANFVAAIGGQGAAARARGIEARQEEGDRRQKLLSDLGAERKEKGASRVLNKEKLRESERAYGTELKKMKLARQEARSAQQSAAAAAALDRIESARKAQSDAIAAQQAQERIGISRKNARTSARSQKATARHYREGEKGGMTRAERAEAKAGHRNALATAKSLIKQRGKPIRTPVEWAELEEAVRLESEVSPSEARAAVKRLQQAAAAKGKSTRRAVARGKGGAPH